MVIQQPPTVILENDSSNIEAVRPGFLRWWRWWSVVECGGGGGGGGVRRRCEEE